MGEGFLTPKVGYAEEETKGCRELVVSVEVEDG
jgi:hypothetical protein